MDEEWKTVKRKKGKKERRKIVKERSEAVIIHPTEGRSYADVLRNIRSKIKPEAWGIAIRAVRKTKTGAILIAMCKGERREQRRRTEKMW